MQLVATHVVGSAIPTPRLRNAVKIVMSDIVIHRPKPTCKKGSGEKLGFVANVRKFSRTRYNF
jgi:hypothetical protein